LCILLGLDGSVAAHGGFSRVFLTQVSSNPHPATLIYYSKEAE